MLRPCWANSEIHSFDLGFKLATLEVATDSRYTVKLVNDGTIVHDITFPDGTKMAPQPGATNSLDVDVPAAGLTFICSIPGHEQAGMKGTIGLTGAKDTSPSATMSADDHGGPAPTTDVAADANAPSSTQ